MKIEIVSLRLIEPKESGLHGFADVKLDNVLIRDFHIFERNGKPFIQPPYNTVKKNGKIEFHSIVELSKEMQAAVDAAILTRYFREKEVSHAESCR